jgi:hypothetical protein
MIHLSRHVCSACGIIIALLGSTAGSATLGQAAPAPAGDGLSGTWRVSRTCLTYCVSTPPARRVVVRHQHGDVYITAAQPPQVLSRLGGKVLVHGPKDSLLLTIDSPGRLMSGVGVGADGSTFKTTWQCIAPARSSVAIPGNKPARIDATNPALMPAAMGAC